MTLFRSIIGTISVGLSVFVAVPSQGAEFYKGKTVTLMVPSGLGCMARIALLDCNADEHPGSAILNTC